MQTSLTTAPFGTTGWDITRVGFGAWAVGGGGWSGSWGPTDDDTSVAAIRYAVEQGVNWVDTAWVYGYGHSEQVVRRALSVYSDADRPKVFTKCGPVEPADRMSDAMSTGNVAVLREQVLASLARLKVDQVDLMQMHWPAEDDVELEVYWQALLDMKAEGLFAAVGLSNFDTAQLDTAEALGHVDSLQPPFSLLDRNAGADVVPWCAAHGTGVIVYSPMASGLLTGAFTAERVAGLAADDWRRSDDAFTADLDQNLTLVDALRPVAERHGASLAEVAIAWTLAWDGVTAAIVGARSADQVDGWCGAGALTLSDDDLADIAGAVASTGAGEGPARPA